MKKLFAVLFVAGLLIGCVYNSNPPSLYIGTYEIRSEEAMKPEFRDKAQEMADELARRLGYECHTKPGYRNEQVFFRLVPKDWIPGRLFIEISWEPNSNLGWMGFWGYSITIDKRNGTEGMEEVARVRSIIESVMKEHPMFRWKYYLQTKKSMWV